MTESWEAQVVAELCELKRAGWEFDRAWDRATANYRPRLRDQMSDRLFETDETGNPVERTQTLLEFFHDACFDAWHGYNPKLRGLSRALADGFGDRTRMTAPTTRHGSGRARMAA